MKINFDNWKEIRKKILDAGIDRVEYDSQEKLKLIITKSGERYECTQELFEKFKNAEYLRQGRRIKNN